MGLTLLFPVFGPAVFVLAVPAFSYLIKRADDTIFRVAFIFCLGLCITGYFPAFYIRPGFDPILTFLINLLLYIILCLLHSLALSVSLWLGFKLTNKCALRCIYVPIFWAAAEWFIGSGPFAWPTLRLSLALWQYPVFIQWASFGGQLLVSAVIVAVNLFLAFTICKLKSRRAFFCAAAAVTIFTINLIPVFFMDSHTGKTVTAVLVQPGVTVVGEDRGDVYVRALDLCEKAAQAKPDIILVSESVLPYGFDEDEYLQKEWSDIAKTAQADVIVGGRLNGHAAAYHFDSNGALKTVAPKKREVPLFENGVVDRQFRLIIDNSANIVSTKNADMGILICYESMFSAMARNAANDGASLLSVITNDSWFDDDTAKNLHLAHGIYRAAETGRPLIQSGINGRTAAIQKNGIVTDIINHNESEILEVNIEIQAKNTPYLIWGDWWLTLGVLFILGPKVILKFLFKK